MNGTELTVAIVLCAVAIVALYFVQDKRARAGIGLVAIAVAFIAGLRRKPEQEPDAVIKPDTYEAEREEIENEIHTLDDAVDRRIDTDPDVAALRARLKAHRGSLHDAIGDREND